MRHMRHMRHMRYVRSRCMHHLRHLLHLSCLRCLWVQAMARSAEAEEQQPLLSFESATGLRFKHFGLLQQASATLNQPHP